MAIQITMANSIIQSIFRLVVHESSKGKCHVTKYESMKMDCKF